VEGYDGSTARDEGFDIAGVGSARHYAPQHLPWLRQNEQVRSALSLRRCVDGGHPFFGEGCCTDDGVEGVGVSVFACGLEEVGGGERQCFRHGFDPELGQGPREGGAVGSRVDDFDQCDGADDDGYFIRTGPLEEGEHVVVFGDDARESFSVEHDRSSL